MLKVWRALALVLTAMVFVLLGGFVIQAGTLHADWRLNLGTLPEWLSALGGVATLAAVGVAWLAYKGEVNARLDDWRKNSLNHAAPVMMFLPDCNPRGLFLGDIVMPEQMKAWANRPRVVSSLKEQWAATKGRFVAFFVSHPSQEISFAAFQLSTALDQLFALLPVRADLTERLYQIMVPEPEGPVKTEVTDNEAEEIQAIMQQVPDEALDRIWRRCELHASELMDLIYSWGKKSG